MLIKGNFLLKQRLFSQFFIKYLFIPVKTNKKLKIETMEKPSSDPQNLTAVEDLQNSKSNANKEVEGINVAADSEELKDNESLPGVDCLLQKSAKNIGKNTLKFIFYVG